MKTHEEGRSGALALDVWLASETPRSNAACAAWESGLGDGPSVSLVFAQRLERENAKLREALSACVNADDWTKELEEQATDALANIEHDRTRRTDAR
jgi:hypothetical protein